MMRLPAEMVEEIKAHCIEELPREACGLVLDARGVDGLEWWPVPNCHPEPETHFFMPNEICSPVMPRARAVIHSHPPGGVHDFSEADIEGQAAMALPWGLVGFDADGNVLEEIKWLGG